MQQSIPRSRTRGAWLQIPQSLKEPLKNMRFYLFLSKWDRDHSLLVAPAHTLLFPFIHQLWGSLNPSLSQAKTLQSQKEGQHRGKWFLPR